MVPHGPSQPGSEVQTNLLGILPSSSQLYLSSGAASITADLTQANERPLSTSHDSHAPHSMFIQVHTMLFSNALPDPEQRAEICLSSAPLSSAAARSAPLSTPTKSLITQMSVAGEPAIFYLPHERDSKSNCTF